MTAEKKNGLTDEQRVHGSRMLVVAFASEGWRTTSQLAEDIDRWLDAARSCQKRFYFDLGWGESLRTAVQSLAALNWIEVHENAVRTTNLGMSHLRSNSWDPLERESGGWAVVWEKAGFGRPKPENEQQSTEQPV